jgi:membrane-associated PAP2 superfamily phosphatase
LNLSNLRSFPDVGVHSERAPSVAARVGSRTDYYGIHLVVPLLAFAILLSWLELAGGNRVIADQLYAWQGGRWFFKHHFLTSWLIHPGGKYLSLMMWLGVFILYVHSRRSSGLEFLRRPLVFLLLSTLTAVILVSALKATVAMDCPWDMQAYGGLRPYLGLFDARPIGLHDSGCFPAGHAGAGYAWVALYFFFAAVAPRWRLHGLAVGLPLGALFGFSQQLRGAHFLSHDLVALMLCWLTALALSACLRLERVEVGR